MINDLPNLGNALRERVNPASLSPARKNDFADKAKDGVEQTPDDNDQASFSKVLEKNSKPDWPQRSGVDSRVDVKNPVMKPTDTKAAQENERSAKEIGTSVNETEEPQFEPEVAKANRQMAMLKFMDSMESEFGIPPERIVEAMATLKPADLVKPPEETALQIMDQLDLKDEDRDKALVMYLGMLQQTKTVEAAPTMTAAPLGQARSEFSPKVPQQLQSLNDGSQLSVKDRKAMLNDSLDRMTRKFFLNDRLEQAPGMDAYAQAQMQGKMERTPNENGKAVPIDPNLMQPVDQTQNQSLDPKLAALAAAGLAQKNMSDAAAAQQQAPLNTKGMPEEKTEGPSLSGAKGDSLLKSLSAAVTGAAAHAGAGSKGSGLSSDGDDSDSSKSDDLSAQSTDQSQFFPQHQVKEGAAFAGLVAADRMMDTGKSGDNPNVDKIISQAQVVVKAGGGEAVVKLNPDGLGEVKLKIAVKDGRVQVDMAAETPEAKKLIESSIGDLKSALSTQKLSVDHVKVDVGTQLSGDPQKNPDQPMNFRQDMGREQARQFMNQFREENMARRDPFYETNGVKNYQRNSAAPMEPVSSKQATRRYAGEGRGERMNIVA